MILRDLVLDDPVHVIFSVWFYIHDLARSCLGWSCPCNLLCVITSVRDPVYELGVILSLSLWNPIPSDLVLIKLDQQSFKKWINIHTVVISASPSSFFFCTWLLHTQQLSMCHISRLLLMIKWDGQILHLKGRYNIGRPNDCKTASIGTCILTFFESNYTSDNHSVQLNAQHMKQTFALHICVYFLWNEITSDRIICQDNWYLFPLHIKFAFGLSFGNFVKLCNVSS